jgi:hypothetical protein
MPLPPKLRDRLISQFEKLVSDGEAIHKAIRVVPGEWHEPWIRTQEPFQDPDRHVVEWQPFVVWRTRCVSLLTQAVGGSAAHADVPHGFKGLSNAKSELELGIATLKALRADLAEGYLDDVADQVEAMIAADYLQQAESLLEIGARGVAEHVPAAVLAGAVLERALRARCANVSPPIPTVGSDGQPFTMNRLVDELKKAAVIDELRAKQLRWYADIRNKAAAWRVR